MVGHEKPHQLQGSRGDSWSLAPFHRWRPRLGSRAHPARVVVPLDHVTKAEKRSDATHLKKLPNPLRLNYLSRPLSSQWLRIITCQATHLSLNNYLLFAKMPVVAGPPAAGPSTFDKSMLLTTRYTYIYR